LDDAQNRGEAWFEKGGERVAYGQPGSRLELDLVYNPGGAFLPPAQGPIEATYKQELATAFGIVFHRLLTITNMPIARFAQALAREGKHEAYMSLLANHFNPATTSGVMCRSLVSVGWDGKLYDCDFNQMLELPLGASGPTGAPTIWSVTDLRAVRGARVHTAAHCFGCTAGAGSSCSGAVA
jgi:radical SAM/Cys-rich protein